MSHAEAGRLGGLKHKGGISKASSDTHNRIMAESLIRGRKLYRAGVVIKKLKKQFTKALKTNNEPKIRRLRKRYEKVKDIKHRIKIGSIKPTVYFIKGGGK